jgi:hypothetical protein
MATHKIKIQHPQHGEILGVATDGRSRLQQSNRNADRQVRLIPMELTGIIDGAPVSLGQVQFTRRMWGFFVSGNAMKLTVNGQELTVTATEPSQRPNPVAQIAPNLTAEQIAEISKQVSERLLAAGK